MAQTAQDHRTEARELLEQFAKLPEAIQTGFVSHVTSHPDIASNPELVQQAMKQLIEEQRKPAVQLEALLQLSPAAHAHGHKTEQEVALANLVTQTNTVRVEVQQALERGETAQQIQAKAATQDASHANATVAAVQEHEEKAHRQHVAESDAVHREKVGLNHGAPQDFSSMLSGVNISSELVAMNNQQYAAAAAKLTIPGQQRDQGVGGRS